MSGSRPPTTIQPLNFRFAGLAGTPVGINNRYIPILVTSNSEKSAASYLMDTKNPETLIVLPPNSRVFGIPGTSEMICIHSNAKLDIAEIHSTEKSATYRAKCTLEFDERSDLPNVSCAFVSDSAILSFEDHSGHVSCHEINLRDRSIEPTEDLVVATKDCRVAIDNISMIASSSDKNEFSVELQNLTGNTANLPHTFTLKCTSYPEENLVALIRGFDRFNDLHAQELFLEVYALNPTTQTAIVVCTIRNISDAKFLENGLMAIRESGRDRKIFIMNPYHADAKQQIELQPGQNCRDYCVTGDNLLTFQCDAKLSCTMVTYDYSLAPKLEDAIGTTMPRDISNTMSRYYGALFTTAKEQFDEKQELKNSRDTSVRNYVEFVMKEIDPASEEKKMLTDLLKNLEKRDEKTSYSACIKKALNRSEVSEEKCLEPVKHLFTWIRDLDSKVKAEERKGFQP